MKRISMIVLACLITLTASNIFGQTRRRTTTGRRSRSSAARNQTNGATSASVAARLAEQIKSIGKFLYLYGPLWKELAANEASLQGDRQSTAAEAMERNRTRLRELFHNYRVQMDDLETTFSGSSELRPYYTKLLGVAASAGQAEESVASSRYDQAGRSLLDVMNRLTDVLVDMQAR